jgi:hypothetical protein
MITYLTHVKDVMNNNYIGIKFDKSVIKNYLDDLKEHLGDDYDEYVKNQQNRDRGSYHMTVINVMDYNSLSKSIGMSEFVEQVGKLFTYEIDDLKLMGVGTATNGANTTYFIVGKSDKLDAIRKRYELKEHDFHITIGFKYKDVFGVRKNEVMPKKSKFIDIFRQKFMERENFEFLKQINNWDENPNKEIIPIALKDDHLIIKVDNNLLRIGIIDVTTGSEMRITNKYHDDGDSKRLPLTNIIGFLKEKN